MTDPFEAYEQRIKKLEGVLADVAAAFDCKPDDHSDLIEAAKLLRKEASAAPELLAALKMALEGLDFAQAQVDCQRDQRKLLSYLGLAQSAITKAEGRTA